MIAKTMGGVTEVQIKVENQAKIVQTSEEYNSNRIYDKHILLYQQKILNTSD